jgi:hypothetical protein
MGLVKPSVSRNSEIGTNGRKCPAASKNQGIVWFETGRFALSACSGIEARAAVQAGCFDD